VPETVELALLHENTRYVILADVIQTLVCFDVEQRLRETASVKPAAVVMQVTHGLYEHQPMEMPQLQLWNESVEKLT
jgi:hypothetical protein